MKTEWFFYNIWNVFGYSIFPTSISIKYSYVAPMSVEIFGRMRSKISISRFECMIECKNWNTLYIDGRWYIFPLRSVNMLKLQVEQRIDYTCCCCPTVYVLTIPLWGLFGINYEDIKRLLCYFKSYYWALHFYMPNETRIDVCK